ncbi:MULTISPECIES: porin family protein [Flavobacterium]|uniref:Outer membrane protein with beta-barrel domain n=1 Tax=Flavobacterium weaverense TaxID=271156 RepID=A0A3M0A7J8_9FLAO|nr:porin family protein [Flavobacterium weaverense]RMA75062.1 outer membrane protein with beta-barrel domain [Flavobacterium weaverense]
MKRVILAAVVLLVGSATMQAQSVRFGFKGGLNFANQTGSEIRVNSTNYKTDAITSYHGGLIAEIKLTEGFAIQPELLYSTVGASYKNAVEEFENELGYLSIPVMAKISLGKAVSLDLGPQASILLSEKNKFDAKNAETFDFGLAGGLSFNITDNFFLQGRYVLGLTDASKEAQVKNSVVQVSAGFKF